MKASGRRTVLITGSTDGMGRWLAVRLAGSGAHVLVHGRSAQRAEQVCHEIREATGEDRAEALLADLADLSQADRLADDVLARTDRLDVLVNTAGIGAASPGGARQADPRGVERRFAVNYLAGCRRHTRSPRRPAGVQRGRPQTTARALRGADRPGRGRRATGGPTRRRSGAAIG